MLNEITQRHLAYHDTDRPMAVMEVDYPDGSTTGWHRHPRGQLLYAIAGVMVVRSAVGSWVVPSDRALWLAAGLNHEVRMVGAVKIRTVFIDQSAVSNVPAHTCVVAVSPLLRELIVAGAKIPLDQPLTGRDERLLCLLIDELTLSPVLPLHLPLPNEPRLAAICRALVDDPASSATAEEWGNRLGITAKTIHRLFVKETGMRFAQWRQQARLLHGLSRIAQGDRLIDVAFDCGYASQSAFTAMFRRHFGVPPSGFFHPSPR